MTGNYHFDHRSYYDISRDRTVPIRSAVGQAQFFLSAARQWISAPDEWLLLCRFANTIDVSYGEYELRQLRRLTRHLDQRNFENRHGYADPVVAREVEREIVLRQGKDFPGGYDLTPAINLLADYEGKAPVFGQPERNLILREAFFLGNQDRTAKTAEAFREKRLSPHGIEKLCRELEEVEREWAGVDIADGLQYRQTKSPGFNLSLKDCEDPQTHYPPFACYPSCDLPMDSIVLPDGAILVPDQDHWFYSSLQKVDRTFTTLHFYKSVGCGVFEIADQEHEEQYQYQNPELAEEAPLIGQVTFADGDLWNFTDAQKYLRVVQDELPHRLATGFRCETLTDDPVVRKAVDDMRYAMYEEENPRTLADYRGITMTMGGMG